MIYWIYSNIMSKWMVKIFRIQKNPNQWFGRKIKDTKLIIFANSCYLKKVALNPL